MKKKLTKIEIHKLADGELHIVQLNGTNNWTARFLPKKIYKTKNLHNSNIENARQIAYDWYASFTKIRKNGKPVMAKSVSHTITEIHKYIDGKLHIYKQSNTKNWYAKFHMEKKYLYKSLKETKFEIAKEIAHEWYYEIKGKQKTGIPIHGHKFKDVLPNFFAYQKVPNSTYKCNSDSR